MALYVYRQDTGELVSWGPTDDTQVATAEQLAAQGLSVVTGLAALDDTHGWDAATHSVVTIAATLPVKSVSTAKWILRFTPAEMDAILASSNAAVRQMLYALNHSTEVNVNDPDVTNGVALLIGLGLLDQSRSAAILA